MTTDAIRRWTTSSPIGVDCEDQGLTDLTVSVQTDNFPTENSWNVVYSSNGAEIMAVSTYNNLNEVISKSACVDISLGCMTLTVNDSWGDGIITDNAITAELGGGEIYSSGLASSTNPFLTLVAYLGDEDDCEGYTLPPVALPPTSATSKPSSEPTNIVCTGYDKVLTVSVPTDNYPTENSWSVEYESDGIAIMAVSTYNTENEIISKSACVDPLKCMTLTVFDSYGDGIITDNVITAVLDGEEIYSRSGNSISSFETFTADLGECDGSPTNPMNPTKAPVRDPTEAPAGPGSCQTKGLLEIYLNTDNKGNENKIVVKKLKKNGQGWGNRRFVDEENFASNQLTKIERCLKKSKCYQVKITDKGNDGICCKNGKGSVRIVWDGTEVTDTKFKSGKQKKVRVNCDD